MRVFPCPLWGIREDLDVEYEYVDIFKKTCHEANVVQNRLYRQSTNLSNNSYYLENFAYFKIKNAF